MSFPSWAKVGAKVVCINDELGHFRVPGINYNTNNGLDGLTKGRIYTIRSCYESSAVSNRLAIRLEEIIRAGVRTIYNSDKNPESGFSLERFRPLIKKTKEEDMAIFVPLLNTMKIDETV